MTDKIIPGENSNINVRPILNKEEIIYNPIKDEEIRPFTSSSNNRQFNSVPNFNNIIPEIGVRIGIGNQTKNGGLNFNNQYGRMSMKEYEILREKYMGKGNKKNHPIHSISNQDFNYKNENSNLNYNNNNVNYSNNNNSKKNVQGSNDKIINYNWNNNTDISNNNNLDNIPRTGNIINENLFKNRTSKGMKTNTKNLNSNTGYNNSNNEVISNQEYNNIQRNIHSNSKRMGETNLRTRKK